MKFSLDALYENDTQDITVDKRSCDITNLCRSGLVTIYEIDWDTDIRSPEVCDSYLSSFVFDRSDGINNT